MWLVIQLLLIYAVSINTAALPHVLSSVVFSLSAELQHFLHKTSGACQKAEGMISVPYHY